MARGRTVTTMTTRLRGGDVTLGPDRLVVEEPMEIRLDDHLVASTMRTPGHDYELAVGFCLTEGLLSGAPVRTVRYCATGPASETFYNVVSVSTGAWRRSPRPGRHSTTSSCGLCGTASLDAVRQRLLPSPGAAAAVQLSSPGPGGRRHPCPPTPVRGDRSRSTPPRTSTRSRARSAWSGRTSAATTRWTR